MGKMKILLVDDKAVNLYILETFLQRNGNATVTAANGAEALAIALKSPPDIVVSDILMPVMDGFVLCRNWKKNEMLQKIPFVFYTATYTSSEDEGLALSLGADRFIVKPQDLNVFLQLIIETYETYRMRTVRRILAPLPEETIFLKEYNEVLVSKLEEKMIQIEAAEKELWEKNALLGKDIEELKRAEAAGRESEERFRMVFENVFDGISIYNEDPDPSKRTLIECNERYAAMAGRSREELLKLGSTQGLQKPLEDSTNDSRLRALHSMTVYQGSFSWLRPDGEYNIIEYIGMPITWRGKSYSIGIDRDITARKGSEEMLRNERLLLRTLIDNLPDAIYAKDSSCRKTLANLAEVHNIGVKSEAEVLGKDDFEFYPKELAEAFFADDQSVLRTGQPVLNREEFVFDEKGQKRWLLTSKLPLRDEGDHIIGLVGVGRDITELKHADQMKSSLEKQLQQAQKLESIGTLASGIAHDFNNILGIIMGHTSLLVRLREDSHMYSESVAAIMKATQRGASLVKQLMLFARKTESLIESVKVNNIILEITKLLLETFPKTITISTSLQQDLPAIVADSSQIHQVLLNLLVNARDAMPSSGTLSISTRTIEGKFVSSQFSKATARQYVQIEVTDTGIGMDEATLQRIFEPFFTTKGPGKGTGLGLAVVFGIVEHHNGFIDVRSTLGKGTSFNVYFPIPERAVEEVQLAKKGLEEMPGGTETILVIEDEEMLRELVKVSLVSKGYTVLTAEDGMQGIEMYQIHQKEIAVVLSDIGLPILSGQDVFRRIRKKNPKAKVILASGFIDPETKSEMYKAGLKEFIQKPYMQDEVLQKIREVIDRKG